MILAEMRARGKAAKFYDPLRKARKEPFETFPARTGGATGLWFLPVTMA